MKLTTSRHGGEVDPFAMQAEPAAGGDQHLAIMERMSIRQRMVQVKQAAQPYRLCGTSAFISVFLRGRHSDLIWRQAMPDNLVASRQALSASRERVIGSTWSSSTFNRPRTSDGTAAPLRVAPMPLGQSHDRAANVVARFSNPSCLPCVGRFKGIGQGEVVTAIPCHMGRTRATTIGRVTLML